MKVLLVPNTSNPRAVAAAARLAGFLQARGETPVLTEKDAGASGLPELGVTRPDLVDVGLVVALGGDGTILKAVHTVGRSEPPVLGVNLGRLGFLTGAGADEAEEAVAAALEGRASMDRRQTLEAEVALGGREVGEHRALNEVYVGRGQSHRAIDVEVSINDLPVFRFSCDGIIVATATGSTAYALSFGGPVLSPGAGGFLLVPVGAHTLKARSMVLAPEDIVQIAFPNPARADGCVIIDGDVVPCRQSLERVRVRLGSHDVVLARVHGREFYEVVREKFTGGD